MSLFWIRFYSDRIRTIPRYSSIITHRLELLDFPVVFHVYLWDFCFAELYDKMLEDQVAYLLQRYLGNYVRGLNKEALKISVWQGEMVFLLLNFSLNLCYVLWYSVATLTCKRMWELRCSWMNIVSSFTRILVLWNWVLLRVLFV